jgi:hypothetical protein
VINILSILAILIVICLDKIITIPFCCKCMCHTFDTRCSALYISNKCIAIFIEVFHQTEQLWLLSLAHGQLCPQLAVLCLPRYQFE